MVLDKLMKQMKQKKWVLMILVKKKELLNFLVELMQELIKKKILN